MQEDDQVQLNVRVHPGVRTSLKALAALRGRGQSEVLEEIVERALEKALVEAADEIKKRGRRLGR
jgi:predicted DNA-binding protein